MAYDNTNRGVLFKNQEKRENGPDYSGKLDVDGVEFFLDAWIKASESGRKFMSVSVKRKDKQGPKAQANPAPRKPQVDDDIPF